MTASAAQLQAANAQARALVLAKGLKMVQSIQSGTIATPGSGANVINVVPRAVGLGQKFTVEITATISAGASTLTPTNLNVANLFSQVIFNDLQNYTRIQTAGWHLNLINSIKEQAVFGAAYSTDCPIKYGNNFNTTASGAGGIGTGPGIIVCPASIGPTLTGVVKMMYEVPLAYSDRDLRGAVYLGVVNSTGLLQLTINPNPVVAAGADATLAMFQSAGASTGAITGLTYNVYQHWWDQLPQGQNGPILPAQDLSTVYELKNTALTGMSQATDFPIAYANYRDFLSTSIIWDNAGSAPANGTDINYWALQSANFTNIWKVDAYLNALFTRKLLRDDPPPGVYYFSSRNKPISTIQYGNLELILNESVAAANGQQVLVGFEDFGLQNTITGAGSLAAG
jgi:hypothetical protein